MQHESVKKLFKEQVRHYSHKDQYKHSPLTQLILECLKNKKTNKKIEICEFGGGAGQLLNEIGKVYPKANLTNVEIIDDYKSFLTSKKVRFVNSSGFKMLCFVRSQIPILEQGGLMLSRVDKIFSFLVY